MVDNDSQEQHAIQTPEATGQLFGASWMDRLVDWIARLPGPSWLAFLLLFLLLGLLVHVALWVVGELTFGSFRPEFFLNQLWIVEVLFFHHILDQDARRALYEFRPLMDVSDEQFSSDLYAFTNLPARPVLLLTLIGLPIGLLLNPGFPGDSTTQNAALLSFVLVFLVGPISTAFALIFAYRIFRHLRIVSDFYAQAPVIDLFDLDPVYALSSHTARTGLALLLAVYSNIAISPESLELSALFILVVLLTLTATISFLLPLRGINRRLVEEKKELLRSTHLRIKTAFEQMDENFDGHELGEMSTLNDAVTGLQNQKTFIENIPTWPWKPTTMRGFLYVVFLPIFIWAVQQILSRIFKL